MTDDAELHYTHGLTKPAIGLPTNRPQRESEQRITRDRCRPPFVRLPDDRFGIEPATKIPPPPVGGTTSDMEAWALKVWKRLRDGGFIE